MSVLPCQQGPGHGVVKDKVEQEKKKWKISKVLLVTGAMIMMILLSTTLHINNSHDDEVHAVTKRSASREMHKAIILPTVHMRNLTAAVNINQLWRVLTPILTVRPPGSRNIKIVEQHITSTLNGLGGWHIEYDRFSDNPPSPYKLTKFTNIIASTNPSASRKLILACHYDSKISSFRFVGATDAAVPCAMILEIARVLDPHLKRRSRNRPQRQSSGTEISLDLVFFDGEEAFVSWSARDSLYGSRHLARKWNRTNLAGTDTTLLQAIDLLVLLDLIGHSQTSFYNFAATRTRWFSHAYGIELAMRFSGLLPQEKRSYFDNKANRYYDGLVIEDDHKPFHDLGVPVMHLISVPFPRVWHTFRDNANALDRRRIEGLTKVLAVFVAEYLHLNISN